MIPRRTTVSYSIDLDADGQPEYVLEKSARAGGVSRCSRTRRALDGTVAMEEILNRNVVRGDRDRNRESDR